MSENTVLKKLKKVVLDLADKYKINVLSIVLYGSRARGDYSFTSDYDCFIFLDEETSLLQYTQFISELRMLIYETGKIKIYSNTPENFLKIMENNPFLGSFCYIIAVDGTSIYDPLEIFKKIKEKVEGMPTARKIEFIKKCIKMSRRLGSPKWVNYWQAELSKQS